MDKKSDDFKAKALDLLSHPRRTIRLSYREQSVLWGIAFGPRDITAADVNQLKFIAEKFEPQEAVA